MLTRYNAGLITAGVCNLCMAASLAEFLSAYPTFVKDCPVLPLGRLLMYFVAREANIIGLLVSDIRFNP